MNVFSTGSVIFLPVAELFGYIKVNCNLTENNSVIKGFFIDESTLYKISIPELSATIKSKNIIVRREDFYVTETDIYISNKLYGEIFGIDLTVDMKRLSVYMKSDNKFPATLDEERKIFRERTETARPKVKADIYLPRRRKILGTGFLDWQASFTHTQPDINGYTYGLALGSEIMGGDFTGNLTGTKDTPADWGNSNWRWRFVEEKEWFRQGIAGDINMTSGLLQGTQGVQLTNALPISRTTLGGYKIFDQTYPYWDVELYINNELISYTKASETGYFEFNIPLLYGSNFMTLKYYGPSGEINTSERVIQVPFTFLPKGDVEYYLSAGKMRTDDHNEVSEASVNWGISSALTIGAGTTYINEPVINKFYPSGNISYKIYGGLIFSGQYFADLKGRASLSFLLPSQISAELNYIKYEKNNYFNPGNLKEEKNFSLFLPATSGQFSSNFRINAREILTGNSKFLFVSPGLFINYNRFQGSILVNGMWQKDNDMYQRQNLLSTTMLSYRFFNDLLIRQQSDIDHVTGSFTKAGIYIDKGVLGAGWLSLSFAKDFTLDSYSAGLNFRFDFPFMRATTDYSTDINGWSVQQSFYGSVGYDDYKNKFITDNRYLSTRAGLTLVPFLDINNNDTLDENEKILETDLEVRMESGQPVKHTDGKNTWYVDLDSYNTYLLEINPMTLDNPLYRPKYKIFSVYTDPSRFKPVPIPIFITGVISGYVSLRETSGLKGAAGIQIILESENGKVKITKQSFSDGEFIFDNVPPGKYRLYADAEGLSKRGLTPESMELKIEIKAVEEGDIVTDIEFVLVKKEK